ncbi:DUF2441 domain-containing protein [Enterococcus sp. AZ102]|uniref:DUF2441 domain-containing protein n=1 Tax=Enterococcus sp. AZ102 TaxID=2774865 RepID=UPI003F21152E
MKAYHIDRNNLLKENTIYTLDNQISVSPKILEPIVKNYYPDGLSLHGKRYFSEPSNIDYVGTTIYESIFEYERKLYYANKNSRYQSFFAVKQIDDLKKWLNLFSVNNLNEYSIWEIDTLDSIVQEFDASFLIGGDLNSLKSFSPLVVSYKAKKYWDSELSNDPLKELLIYPEIKTLKRIAISSIF